MSCTEQPLDYKALHQDAIVVDLHSDTPLRMRRGIDFSVRDTAGHMDIPRLQEGGIDLQVFACWISTGTLLDSCKAKVDELIDTLESQIKKNPDKIEICLTAADAERIIGEGKIAAFIGIENGVAIASDISNVDYFYNRGVRYMTLTHTESSDWCISSGDDEPAFKGLTDFGRDVVRRMNELGMIVDISHAHVDAVEEVLKITTDPIIASHSCVYALCEHDRNLTDEQIRAIAENGGVIGINFYNTYLSQEWKEKADSLYGLIRPQVKMLMEKYKDDDSARYGAIMELYGQITPHMDSLTVDVNTVVDHIDYIVKLVGPEYVGFGSDYDGVPVVPKGLDDCSMVPNITAELVNRGYSEKDIRKILGENFMRVFRQVCD
ncbi:MAG: dipeptidase [candidate division Zixibacteria bacterium]|nr:dipeptidase [candidate division Zixibacteria bacterium]